MIPKINESIPRLSVVIVSFNSREYLADCIAGIMRDAHCREYEIIVVDNNSDDGSVGMIRKSFPQATIIPNKENRGFAAACNQGIRASSASYILLLNPDTLVQPGNLEKALAFMEENPCAGIVGCRILNPDGSVQPSIRNFPGLWNCFIESVFLYKLFPQWSLFGAYHGVSIDYNRAQEAKALLGAIFLIRKSLIDRIGLLDERFFVYSEETDFCRRSIDAGWKNMYTPAAEITHFGGGSARLTAVSSFILLHRSLNDYACKHFSSVRAGIFSLLLFAGAALRMLLWTGISILGRNDHAAQKRKIYSGVVQWYCGLRKE